MPQNQLHDGLRLLQQPYSEAVAEAVLEFLETANPRVQGTSSVQQRSDDHTPCPAPSTSSLKDDASEVPEMLGLLNMYLGWLLSGVPGQLSAAQVATTSSSSSSDGCLCLPGVHYALSRGLILCVTHLNDVLVSAASAQSEQVEAAVRPHLVAQGTGEHLCACIACIISGTPSAARGCSQQSPCVGVQAPWCAARDAHPMKQAWPAVGVGHCQQAYQGAALLTGCRHPEPFGTDGRQRPPAAASGLVPSWVLQHCVVRLGCSNIPSHSHDSSQHHP